MGFLYRKYHITSFYTSTTLGQPGNCCRENISHMRIHTPTHGYWDSFVMSWQCSWGECEWCLLTMNACIENHSNWWGKERPFRSCYSESSLGLRGIMDSPMITFLIWSECVEDSFGCYLQGMYRTCRQECEIEIKTSVGCECFCNQQHAHFSSTHKCYISVVYVLWILKLIVKLNDLLTIVIFRLFKSEHSYLWSFFIHIPACVLYSSHI